MVLANGTQHIVVVDNTYSIRSVFGVVGRLVAENDQCQHGGPIEEPGGEAKKVDQTFDVARDDEKN